MAELEDKYFKGDLTVEELVGTAPAGQCHRPLRRR